MNTFRQNGRLAHRIAFVVCVVGLGLAFPTLTRAGFLITSQQGTLTTDDEVQTFTFAVGDPVNHLMLRSWSYAGGINGAGDVIPAGGFDIILSLFDAAGNLLGSADDGASEVDPVTGSSFDALFFITVGPGTYTVAVSEFNNFANGPTFADGFSRAGDGDFTGVDYGPGTGAFFDVNHAQRDGHWAADVINTPEPSGLVLLGTGALTLFGLGQLRRKRIR